MIRHLSTTGMGISVALACLFFSAGCEGPQGPPGTDAGVSFEGFAEGIECADCHNPDVDTTFYLAGRRYQWERSVHATGGTIERNGTNCAGCHTTEGFIQRDQAGWVSQVVTEELNPSPVGCFACHSPHSRADFSLRSTDPVSIEPFVAGAPVAVFDYGDGNLCVRCHQTRTSSAMSPIPDPTKTAATDTISITSSRWYPHYGVQGQMLMGTGGFEFVDFTYTGSSNHASNNILKEEGCKKCHMAETTSGGTGEGGGHTMKIAYDDEGEEEFMVAGCEDAACHGDGIDSPDIVGPSTGGVGAQTLVTAYMDTLYDLLSQRGWINADLLVVASSSSPLKIAPESRSGALYNFFFILHEGSEGVHNTKYAVELLQSSLAELRKP